MTETLFNGAGPGARPSPKWSGGCGAWGLTLQYGVIPDGCPALGRAEVRDP